MGGLGGTYGGNPLACAAALAVLDAMERERIPERARRTGEPGRARFRQWAERYPASATFAGSAPWWDGAGDRPRDPDARQGAHRPAPRRGARRGLILLSAGTYGNIVRVLAPLTADDAMLDEGLDAMGEALAEAVGLSTAP